MVKRIEYGKAFHKSDTAQERFFEKHGEPLFSSHMLDLSEEPLEENVEICVKYLERMAKMNCGLEMELGITGGEEDGVNNEDANPEDLYSKPEEGELSESRDPTICIQVYMLYEVYLRHKKHTVTHIKIY